MDGVFRSDTAANWLLYQGSVAVETQEFVYQDDAEGLRILLLPGVRIEGLCFEFKRGFPQVMVKEEEPWREHGFGEM
jgi:hypothetical protein